MLVDVEKHRGVRWANAPVPSVLFFSTEEKLRNTQKLEIGGTGKVNGLVESSVGQRSFVGAKNLLPEQSGYSRKIPFPCKSAHSVY